ncbi:MAG: enhanced serine sensitivity protein SseB [Thomasclavelia sp.]|nr:enhanced serine sensitivity protein SseB [Thomasclavelia sp.]
MNINEPISNPVLIDIIEKLKNNSETQQAFFEELAKSKLLCPADIQLHNSSRDGNKIVVGEETLISVKHLEDTKGNKFLIAFTDWKELYKWNSSKDQQTLIFSYKDYQNIMKEAKDVYSGMVINPFGANIVITLSMLDGMEKNYIVKKEERVFIGIPAQYPTELINELCVLFNKEKNVEKAYLLWMVRGDEGSYLLILDSKENSNILYPKVGNCCSKFLKDKKLDIVSASSGFGKNTIKEYQPFYQRK